MHLSIRHVFKRFGRFEALNDVSLDIARGEFVCVLGPSGCGKTTLLRIVAGLEKQDSGQLVQEGRDISRLPAERRNFGIVFQSYALFPNLTAAQNIAYGLENMRQPRSQVKARVEELLSLVGMPECRDRYPSQLSGGQQQRVALARALAPSPSLLLLDEPLSALDAQVRVNLREEVVQLQRRLGVTTIMVTHDQAEALSMADRVVVMQAGRVIQADSPAGIYQRPATPFVARFVGAMNFLPGTLSGRNEVRAGRLRLLVSRPADDLAEIKSDTKVHAAIRPEDIRIAGVSLGMQNTIVARVSAIEFLGSFHRLSFDLGQPPVRLLADVTAQDARSLGSNLRPGADLTVQLPQDRILIFGSA